MQTTERGVEATAAALLAGATRRRVTLAERGIELALLDWPCTGPAVRATTAGGGKAGHAPLALLHHANGFCAAMWALVVPRLRERYRVIALDARGHGDSSSPPPGEAYAWMEFVEDLVALAERLVAEQHGEPIALGVGNSFGGLVTAYAATQRPDLFARIAMLDPVLRPPPHLIEEMLLRLVGADRAAFASRGNPMAIAARKRREVWPSRAVAFEAWRGKDMFDRFHAGALELYVAEGLRDREDGEVELKCRREVEASVFDAPMELDLYEVADRLSAPTLLVRAARGHFPSSVFEALAARIPHADYRDLDIDHLMPMTDPARVADELLGWLCGE